MFLQRRPSPLGDASIGFWNNVLFLMLIMGVYTNTFISSYLFGSYYQSDTLLQDTLFLIGQILGILVIMSIKIIYRKKEPKVC